MASTQSTPASRELALLDKVEFRIAFADTDVKLQTILATYLAPILLKLSSEHEAVRNKVRQMQAPLIQVISICQHINKRIEPQTIQLPVAALIKQFKETRSQLLRHFDLIYATQGTTRLLSSEQAGLFPLLASGIGSLNASPSQLSGAFHLLLRTLVHYSLPPKGSPENDALGATLATSETDTHLLSDLFSKLFLFKITGQPKDGYQCPGLSSEDVSFLTLDKKFEIWDPKANGLNLVEVKVRVLQLLSSGLFSDSERVLPCLLASGDSNSRIADTADDLLKRASIESITGAKERIDQLWELYFGRRASEGRSFVEHVGPRLRARLLGLIGKSDLAFTAHEHVVRLVEQDLLSDYKVENRADLETIKLRTAIIGFLNLVVKRASKAELAKIATPVVDALKLFIEQEAHHSQSAEVKQVRGKSFELVGLMATSGYREENNAEIDLLRWLLACLAEEPDKDVLVSIDQAVSLLLSRLRTVDTQSDALQEVLLGFSKTKARNSRNLRYATLRLANQCLPWTNVVARWLDVVALGQVAVNSHEAGEEARKGLDIYWTQHLRGGQTREQAFPAFVPLSAYFFWENDHDPVSEVSVVAARFCRNALFWNSLLDVGKPISLTPDWERRLDLAVSDDQEARSVMAKNLGTRLADAQFRNALISLANVSFKTLSSDKLDAKQRGEGGATFFDICSLSPLDFRKGMVDVCSNLGILTSDNDPVIRRLAAKSFAILASSSDTFETTKSADVTRLLSFTKTNQIDGALLAVGGLLARTTSDSYLVDLVSVLLEIIKGSSNTVLLGTAFEVIGELAVFHRLAPSTIESSLSEVIEKAHAKAKGGDERAIKALGHLSMVVDNEATLDNILDRLYSLHDLRQSETQFAVGEALAAVACGPKSTAVQAMIDRYPVPDITSKRFVSILEKVTAECSASKPSLRKYCGAQPEIQSRLRILQAVFKRCLTDRDELIQESASRGLGLLFEAGSQDLKDDLIRDLVASFSNERTEGSLAGTVNENTQLFDEGALPTGDGSVSTYKDIMSLASEVGDSSLVYRFMSMASSDALWSSRAAFGRFGLGNIFSDSAADGYLASNPKLFVKLFRYRFDPNPKVRSAMNEIWKSLVKDSTATIEEHFAAIVEDLLSNMLGREWRVRQASCSGLADALSGRDVEKVNPFMERLWTNCFKVLDDIKGSVRGAAAELSRVLTGLVMRSLQTDTTTAAKAVSVLDTIVPFLFSPSGLQSSAQEVVGSALHTLLEICKHAKPAALRPFIPQMVVGMVSLMTDLEPDVVNYAYQNASRYNLNEHDIDERRLASVRSSPLMDAIEKCLDALDEASMAALAAALQGAIKSAVGVPSKCALALVLVTLSTRRRFLFAPHADAFVRFVPKYLADRNETVAQAYAAALGYMARSAADAAVVQLAALARRQYLAADDDAARSMAAEIVRAVSKHAADKFAALASEFLPLVYLGKHDEAKHVKDTFALVWSDNTGGPRAATVYLGEIVQLAHAQLATSPRWNIKHAAALALSNLVLALIAIQGTISESNAALVWPTLKLALQEKAWAGKDDVVGALAGFAERAPIDAMGLGDEVLQWFTAGWIHWLTLEISVREAKRRNRAYSTAAISCLGRVAACASAPPGAFDALCGIVAAALDDDEKADDMELDTPGAGAAEML